MSLVSVLNHGCAMSIGAVCCRASSFVVVRVRLLLHVSVDCSSLCVSICCFERGYLWLFVNCCPLPVV